MKLICCSDSFSNNYLLLSNQYVQTSTRTCKINIFVKLKSIIINSVMLCGCLGPKCILSFPYEISKTSEKINSTFCLLVMFNLDIVYLKIVCNKTVFFSVSYTNSACLLKYNTILSTDVCQIIIIKLFFICYLIETNTISTIAGQFWYKITYDTTNIIFIYKSNYHLLTPHYIITFKNG